MQLAVGLRRVGHDVYYTEATSVWPYDPFRGMKVDESDYAKPYLAKVGEDFGLGARWGIGAVIRTRNGSVQYGMEPRMRGRTQTLC